MLSHRFVEVGGIRTHFVSLGSGPPVVLLHGLGATHIVWRDNLEALAARHAVYAPDLPGHGQSDKPRLKYGPDTGRRFLEGFFDALGIGRAALVGNSLGGFIALIMALDRPERVSHLALVDSGGLGRQVNWFLRLISIPPFGELLEQPTLASSGTLLRAVFYDRRFATPELAKELYRARYTRGAKAAVLNTVRNGINLFGLRRRAILLDRLPELRMPVLLVWGAQDRILPVAHAYEAVRRLPSARLVVFDQCGHWLQMEKAQEFNQLLLEFLASPGSQGP